MKLRGHHQTRVRLAIFTSLIKYLQSWGIVEASLQTQKQPDNKIRQISS